MIKFVDRNPKHDGYWDFACDRCDTSAIIDAADCRSTEKASEELRRRGGWYVVDNAQLCPAHPHPAAIPPRADLAMDGLTVEMVEAEIYAMITAVRSTKSSRVDALKIAGKIAQRLHAISVRGSLASSRNAEKRTQLQVITAMRKED